MKLGMIAIIYWLRYLELIVRMCRLLCVIEFIYFSVCKGWHCQSALMESDCLCVHIVSDCQYVHIVSDCQYVQAGYGCAFKVGRFNIN